MSKSIDGFVLPYVSSSDLKSVLNIDRDVDCLFIVEELNKIKAQDNRAGWSNRFRDLWHNLTVSPCGSVHLCRSPLSLRTLASYLDLGFRIQTGRFLQQLENGSSSAESGQNSEHNTVGFHEPFPYTLAMIRMVN